MKIILIILTCISIANIAVSNIKNGYSENKLNNDTIITQIQAINFNQYQGLTVDSLLSILPSGYTGMKVGTWRSLKMAEVLYVSYPNNVFVAIHVRNFQHMNPHWQNNSNPTQHWDINLFKQELITFTIAFNHRTCINGCDNINK